MIAIHRGSEILEVGVNQGSIRRFNLMKEDFIRLKFSLAENKPLLIGDYVDLTDYINSCDNENFRIKNSISDQTTKKFVLDRNYYPTFNKGTGGWDYNVKINAYYHQWKNKIFMFNPSKGAAESSFSLTDTIFTHAALLVKNLKFAGFTYNNTEFNVAYQEEFEGQLQAKGMKPITYSAVSNYAALDLIAQAFECEWWLDGGSTIYFGYRKGDENITLTLNEEIADTSISDSDGVHATRIYAFGGTTNVPKHYRDKLVFEVNSYWVENGTIKGVKDSRKPVLSSYFRGNKGKADSRPLTISKATSSKGKFTSEKKTPDIAAVTSTSVVSIEGQTYDVDLSNLKINFKATHLVGPEGESTGLIEVGKDINIRASVVATDGTNEDVIASEVKNIKIDRGTPTTSVSFTNSQRKFSFVPSSIEIRVEVISAKWTYTKHMGDENLVNGKWYDCKLVEFEFSNEQAVISFQKSAQSAETIIRINGGTKDYTAIINPNYEDGGSNILITDYTGELEDIKTYTFPNIVISRVPSQYFSQEDGGVQNGVVQKNLMLPIGTNYVQADGVADANVVEAIMVYDWIYPKTALKVTNVEPFKEWKVEIEEGQTIDTTTYDITLPIEDYEDDLWVDPSKMFAIFQSGNAVGLRFELNYIKKTKDDVTFRLVPNEDYSITVPNEATIPAIDDEIILEGIDVSFLSGSAITNAENELLAQANKDILETSKEDKVVDITLKSTDAYNRGRIALGALTSLVGVLSSEDGAYDSRVLGFEECLDIPWDKPKYIIGDRNYYNRQASIESKLENIERGSITLSGVNIGGGGSNIPIIKVKDSTKPTDANVYSALRSREEFAKRKEEETFSEKVSFNKDIDVKGSTKTKSLSVSNDANISSLDVSNDANIQGHTSMAGGATFGEFQDVAGNIQGAKVDDKGVGTFAGLKSKYFEIYELIYNQQTAEEGVKMFTDRGVIEEVKDITCYGNDRQGTYSDTDEYFKADALIKLRKERDGQLITFKKWDVIHGMVNSIGDSGEYAIGGEAWFRVVSVNQDAFEMEVEIYADRETPAGKNIVPTSSMVIARWGHKDGSTDDGLRRQTSFYLSCEDGNITQLMYVTKPIISLNNYGSIHGVLPPSLYEAVKKVYYYVNKYQPYFYGRGVIIQDLMLLDYLGQPIKQARYRGVWEQNPTEPYVITETTYDTVTHNGSLWQLNASNTKVEPSDDWQDWTKIVSKGDNSSIAAYTIIPDPDKIHLATDGTLSTSTISVKIGEQLPDGTYAEIQDQGELEDKGFTVWYAVDGIGERTMLNISPAAIFELEDGSGRIITEEEGYLLLEGKEIDTNTISSHIALYLVDSKGIDRAVSFIWIVKDGEKGESPLFFGATPSTLSVTIDAGTGKTIEAFEQTVRVFVQRGDKKISPFDDEYGWTVMYDYPIDIEYSEEEGQDYIELYIKIPKGTSTEKIGSVLNIDILLRDDEEITLGRTSITINKPERGIVGSMGNTGPLPYAAGAWNNTTEYPAATDIAPYVLFPNAENGLYYVRTSNEIHKDKDGKDLNPAEESNYGSKGGWRVMPQFEVLFVKMLFANFGRLAKAVFHGDYMFSANGLASSGTYGSYDAFVDGNADNNTPMFDKNGRLSGSFVPNLFLDLENGQLKTNKLSETFVVYPFIDDAAHLAKQIRLSESHNLSVEYHYTPRLVSMPYPTDVTDIVDGETVYIEKMLYEPDGVSSSIIMQPSIEYIQGKDLYLNKGDGPSNFPFWGASVILCADGRLFDERCYRTINGVLSFAPQGTLVSPNYNDSEGYFVVNGRLTKILILEPTSFARLRSFSAKSVFNGDSRNVRYWLVENGSDFVEQNVKIGLNLNGDVRDLVFQKLDITASEGVYGPAYATKFLSQVVGENQLVTYEIDVELDENTDKVGVERICSIKVDK